MEALIADCDDCAGGPTEKIAQAAGLEYATFLFSSHFGIEVELDKPRLIRLYAGMNFQGWFPLLADTFGIHTNPQMIDDFACGEVQFIIKQLESNLRKDVGIRQSLLRLQSANVQLFCASSSAMERVCATFGITGIADMITEERTFSAPSLKLPGKPDPAVYHAAIAACGFSLDKIFAIEDTFNGGTAAGAAGLRWLGCVAYVPTVEREARAVALTKAGCSGIFTSWDTRDATGFLAVVQGLGWANQVYGRS